MTTPPPPPPPNLQAVIRLMSMAISMGTHEYEDASQSMGAWQTDEQSLYQSAIASSLHVTDGLGRGRELCQAPHNPMLNLDMLLSFYSI